MPQPLLRRGLAIFQAQRADDWSRADVQGLIGACLVGQKKYSAAEPLLLSSYEGMTAHAAQIPAPSKYRLADAGDRIVRLYEACAKPEKAAEWRRNRLAHRPPMQTTTTKGRDRVSEPAPGDLFLTIASGREIAPAPR